MGGLFMLQLQHNIIELVVVWVVHDVTILLLTVSGPRQRRDMICDERNITEREREKRNMHEHDFGIDFITRLFSNFDMLVCPTVKGF
jgi:hypothetical protein